MPRVSDISFLPRLRGTEDGLPVMQINDDYYEDLTPESTVKVLDALTKGQKPKPGPQSGRQTSENAAGLTT